MTDALDVELEDSELHSEIRLLANLMVAATGATEPLCQTTIDAILLATEPETAGLWWPGDVVPHPRTS